MISLGDVVQLYQQLQTGLFAALRAHCRSIIVTADIDRKIRTGLALGAVVELLCQVDGRLGEISVEDIRGTAASADQPARLEDLLARATAVLSQARRQVLLEPEIRILGLVVDKLPAVIEEKALAGDAPLPRPPARDARLSFSDTKPFSFREGESIIARDENYLGFLFYVLCDVEVGAMEVCSYQVLDNPGMPAAFHADLARQIWDEARHALYVQSLYESRGGRLGQFPYTNAVVERFLSAEDLLESLIIQQLLQEGNAVETNVVLARTLFEAGRHEEAHSFLTINNDEALHVRIGNRWLDYLAQHQCFDEQQVFARMTRAAQKIKLPVFGTFAWDDDIRAAAGFPAWFINMRRRLFPAVPSQQ